MRKVEFYYKTIFLEFEMFYQKVKFLNWHKSTQNIDCISH